MNEADDALMDRLGHRFRDQGLFEEALTHPSSLGRDRLDTYERLEFLGDRVLGLALAELLMTRFPSESEGALARRFAVLAQRDTLAGVARQIDLGPHLRLAPAEEATGGRDNPTNLADALEALIGALHLDGGFAVARRLIARFWEPLLELDLEPPQDPKTALQEWAQARGLPLPGYREVAREGPPHEPIFTIEAEVRTDPPMHASASGRSKRLAERAAAANLLVILKERS